MRTPYTASVTITPVPIEVISNICHDAASRAAIIVSRVVATVSLVLYDAI